MVRRVLFAVLAATALLALPTVNADTLLIDELNRSRVSAQERPKRGMSMNVVESTWGQPVAKRNAIGEPPITRWEYSSFIVYFEYSHVIHAVVKNYPESLQFFPRPGSIAGEFHFSYFSCGIIPLPGFSERTTTHQP